MAGQLSPFDLLPDGVVVKILEGVGTRDATLSHVWSFLRASAVCKRFLRLACDVKDIEWDLENQDEAVSLINFLLQERVSLSQLHLYTTPRLLGCISVPLLFSAPIRRKIPPKVTVTIEEDAEDDYCENSMVPSTGVGRLLEQMLACRNLESLRMVSECPYTIFVADEYTFPTSHIRELHLEDVLISTKNLQDMLESCTKLETAFFFFKEWVGMGLHILHLKSKSILKLGIQVVEGDLAVKLQTPSLVSLEANVEIQIIAAPTLESLRLEFAPSIQSPPTFEVPSPSLKRLSLSNKQGGPKGDVYWAAIVRPLLLMWETLDSLELDWSSYKVKPNTTVVALDELILNLPAKLGTLLLAGDFLDVLGYPRSGPRVQAKCCVTTLRVDVQQTDFSSFFKLRSLRVALLHPDLVSFLRYGEVSDSAETKRLFAVEAGYELIH